MPHAPESAADLRSVQGGPESASHLGRGEGERENAFTDAVNRLEGGISDVATVIRNQRLLTQCQEMEMDVLKAKLTQMQQELTEKEEAIKNLDKEESSDSWKKQTRKEQERGRRK